MKIKACHFKFKFKCKCDFKVFNSMKSFSSIQSKKIIIQSNQFSVLFGSVQFKLIPDTPTTLAASYHTQENPSLQRWRRWVEGLGLARHLGSRPWVCTPAHGRPIFAPTELPTKQKNLTCVTGHKHNKLFKSSNHINKYSLSCNITATEFSQLKMAAERSLWTYGSVSRANYCTNPSFTQLIHILITFTVFTNPK